MNMQSRQVKLYDVARVERAVTGKIYPAGTVYIQVSACRRADLEQFRITKEAGTLEGKYAAIIPVRPVIPEYLQITLEKSAEEFMRRYVGTNINIQMSAFDRFTLRWQDDLDAQRFVVDSLSAIRYGLEAEGNEINRLQAMKQYFLDAMFARMLKKMDSTTF